MKRTALVRKKPLRREGPSSAREDKPRADATPVKLKKCLCPGCPNSFVPIRPLQDVCGLRCAQKKARLVREATERAERESFKARKEKLKTLGAWAEECRKIVQAIARIRDRHDGCISCDKPATWKGQWHGSHYRPAGNNAAVELHLWNINKACWICNKLYSGRVGEYKPRLVEKIGAEKVAWLDSQTQAVKRTVDYYKRFKRVMGKRLRRIEKARQA